MSEHSHSCTSNTKRCFDTFIDCCLIGCVHLDKGEHWMIFDCEWSLVVNWNGAHWTQSPSETIRTLQPFIEKLRDTEGALKNVLKLAGEGRIHEI